MPSTGMRSVFFHSSSSTSPPSPDRLDITMMEENIAEAENIITKWDPQGSAYAKITSIFYESRPEARQFLRAVADLQRAMHFFIADSPVSSSALLVRAQTLMQAAMRRLEKEFYQILSANRDRLDPDSSLSTISTRSSLSTSTSVSSLSDLDVEDDNVDAEDIAGETVGEVESASSAVIDDLRSIAECMTSSGYGRECVKIYRQIRRSIVDEGLYRLGFEKPSASQIQKIDWDLLDPMTRGWLRAVRVAVRTLFAGERVLCDQVFASSSDSIRESCFADIARDPAAQFLAFPEQVASKPKRSPEKIFLLLDLYDSVSELLPEIESVFSHEPTSSVISQAVTSLLKLGDAVRSSFADFESAIQKDNSKAAVPGGAVHPVTRYVMNYVVFLADYSASLANIFLDYPLQINTPLPPESFLFDTSVAPLSSPYASPERNDRNYDPFSPIRTRIAWLILVLLCKLDAKAGFYRPEVALSYVFLANNLHYVVKKVRGSKLSQLLGDEWVAKHEHKARGYAASYERHGWSKVLAAIPDRAAAAEMGVGAANEAMRQFNRAFEDAYRSQAGWSVADGKVRDELKVSIARKLLPAYGAFYERCRVLLRGQSDSAAVVRFAPEDLGNYLSDMFYGNAGSAGSSVSGSSKRSSR